MKIILLAGGKGERFWPRSARPLPKQFLQLHDDQSLLRTTFDRLTGLIDPDSIFVITGTEFKELVRRDLPELPEENVLLEPAGRNTAPAMGLAALYAAQRDPAAVLILLPTDHHVTGEAQFRSTLLAAVDAAAGGHLVTIGVRPTRPETGYGYMQIGPLMSSCAGMAVYKVHGFVEKPDAESARRYLESGQYLWNSGMLVAQIGSLFREIADHLPEVAERLRELDLGPIPCVSLTGTAAEIFAAMPSVSFDYGVLERSARVVTVPAAFSWTDVGDWAALSRVLPLDARGNAVRGEALLQNCDGLVVDAPCGRLVVAIGVQDLAIVDSPGAVLVCEKARAQEVRGVTELAVDIVEALAGARLPVGRSREEHWGREIWWAESPQYAARLIHIHARRIREAATFRRRQETFYVVGGDGRMRIGTSWHQLQAGGVLTVPAGVSCEIEADTDLRLIGVGTPETDGPGPISPDAGVVEKGTS